MGMSVWVRGDGSDRIQEVAREICAEAGMGRVVVGRNGRTYIELSEAESNEFFVADLEREIQKWVGRGVREYQIFGEYES